MQIISGIIIDTFAVLREESQKEQDDMYNYCFICSIDRDTLDKKSDNKKGFNYHVKIEHNMYNYIFFLAYLKDKPSTEFSGFESYVAEMNEKNDISWFPLNQALTLSNTDDEENKKQEVKRETTDQRIQKLESRLSEIQT